MQLTGIQKKPVSVEIPDEEILLAAIKLVERAGDLQLGDSIEEGMVIRTWTERGGSHSWENSKAIREATPDDEKVLATLKHLHQLSRQRGARG